MTYRLLSYSLNLRIDQREALRPSVTEDSLSLWRRLIVKASKYDTCSGADAIAVRRQERGVIVMYVGHLPDGTILAKRTTSPIRFT
jgi:hypothetical protein